MRVVLKLLLRQIILAGIGVLLLCCGDALTTQWMPDLAENQLGEAGACRVAEGTLALPHSRVRRTIPVYIMQGSASSSISDLVTHDS